MRHEALLHGSQERIFTKIEKGHDPLPFCIEVHPTDFCNQGCRYCFGAGKHRTGIETKQREKYMSSSDYGVVFGEMKRSGIDNLSVSGGGEPFLSTDIEKIYASALDNNLIVRALSTNSIN